MGSSERDERQNLEALLKNRPDLLVARDRIGMFFVVRNFGKNTRLITTINLPQKEDEFDIVIQRVADEEWGSITFLVVKPAESENIVETNNLNPELNIRDIFDDLIAGAEIFDAYLQNQDPDKKRSYWDQIQDQTQRSDFIGGVRPEETDGYWTPIAGMLRKPFVVNEIKD